eukprot:6177605-Pleurochrysis_carterae.AAC.4
MQTVPACTRLQRDGGRPTRARAARWQTASQGPTPPPRSPPPARRTRAIDARRGAANVHEVDEMCAQNRHKIVEPRMRDGGDVRARLSRCKREAGDARGARRHQLRRLSD